MPLDISQILGLPFGGQSSPNAVTPELRDAIRNARIGMTRDESAGAFDRSGLNFESAYAGLPMDRLMTAAAVPGISQAAGAARNILPFGFANLFDIIYRQGQTDPRMMNRTIAGIGRGVQEGQDAVTGRLARSGMDQSGVGAAINAAVQGAGTNAVGALMDQEAQRAEARSRSDLQLLNDMIFGPVQNFAALGMGQGLARNQLSQQRGSFGEALLGGLGQLAGGPVGGKIFDKIFGD